MRIGVFGVVALGLLIAACGGNGGLSGSSVGSDNSGAAAAGTAPDTNITDPQTKAPGPMSPDRQSGGGAGARP
jgi:hypothetical protein